MKAVRGYMKERATRNDIPLWTSWRDLGESLQSRAVERFNQKALETLHLPLDRCVGNWITAHILHTGWNNISNPIKRKMKAQAQEQENDRFRLSPSPEARQRYDII